MAVSSTLLPRLFLLGAATLFSTGGVAIKACAFEGWEVAGFRSGISALALVVLLPAARRRWTWRMVAVGCAYAGCLVSYAVANKATTAANVIFLQSSAPLYILALGPFLLRERVRVRDLGLMAVMALGLGLFFADDAASATAPDPLRGNLFGLAAGIFWAFTVMGMRALASGGDSSGEMVDDDALASVVAGNVIAFVVCLPMALPLSSVGAVDWLLLVYLGVFQIGLAYLLLVRGLRHVGAFEASILLLVEPVLTPVWTFLVQAEVPSRWALLGGGLILAAATVKTFFDTRTP
ncbi:MAG: EamA family transporter [Acidobacteriota bacterium]